MGNMEKIFAGHLDREFISIEFEKTPSGLKNAKVQVLGRPGLLQWASQLRTDLTNGKVPDLPPTGVDSSSLLAREIFLKLRGEWNYPYTPEELCHCRAVPTAKVDQAVIHGAHTPERVSEQTSASTACGSCRFDVEAIIKYRLSGS